MKKFTLFFLALFIAVGVSLAQNAEKKWAIGLGPGVSQNLEKNDLLPLGNIYLSRYLSPSFDLMLQPSITFGYGGIDYLNSALNLRYKLSNGYIFQENSKLQPYLFAGPGMLWDNLTNGVNFDAGLGAKIKLSDAASLFVQGAYVKGIEGERNINDRLSPVTDDHFAISGIVEFAFGAAKDSDGDGVPDRKDECPDTPPGVKVDEKGCPLDRDGDGVPDYKDDCPDEPGLAKFNGCPDKDGDGIPDKDDDCPDVAGLAKFKGCPDTDEDGVPDPKDKCPGTPKGCPVDADGCPIDSDGDGVIDCEDKCPTEKGPASNNGCPDWSEITIPTIYFDLNKATLRPEGIAELDKLADQLNSAKEYDIVVGGHTCSVGTDSYNMSLSEKRAQAVVMYLAGKGVDKAAVGSNNYGESKPAVDNNTRSNRELNRRVEFEEAKVRK